MYKALTGRTQRAGSLCVAFPMPLPDPLPEIPADVTVKLACTLVSSTVLLPAMSIWTGVWIATNIWRCKCTKGFLRFRSPA